MTPKQIGHQLKTNRETSGLTYSTVSNETEISMSNLIRIENGDWFSVSEEDIVLFARYLKSPIKETVLRRVSHALENDLDEFNLLPEEVTPEVLTAPALEGRVLARQSQGRPVGLEEILAIVPAGWKRREDEDGFKIDEVLLSWMSGAEIEIQVFTTIHKEHQRSMLRQSFLRVVVMDRRARKYSKVLAWSTRVDRREKRWKEQLGQLLGLLIVRTALRPKCLSCRAEMSIISSSPEVIPETQNSAITSSRNKAVPKEQFWGCSNYPACARRFMVEPLPENFRFVEAKD